MNTAEEISYEVVNRELSRGINFEELKKMGWLPKRVAPCRTVWDYLYDLWDQMVLLRDEKNNLRFI